MKMKVKKFVKQNVVNKELSGRGLRRRLPFTAVPISLPLKGKAVYLHLAGYRSLKPLEEKLLTLGATIEKFLSKDIHYLITCQAKEKCDPSKIADGEGSAGSPAVSTPSPFNMGQTNSGVVSAKKEQPSRGKALCRMAKVDTATSMIDNAKKWGVKVVHIDTALKWIGKEMDKLRATRGQSLLKAQNTKVKGKNCKKEKTLQAPHLKFEAEILQYRPYFLELDNWPYLNIETVPGSCPFDGLNTRGRANRGVVQADRLGAEPVQPRPGVLSSVPEEGGRSTPNLARVAVKPARAKPDSLGFAQIVTAGQLRRIRERRKITNKKKGYCECCKLTYEDLNKHIRGDEHQAYIRNDRSNYNKLDQLIEKGPTAEDFLRAAVDSSRSSSQRTEYSGESWEEQVLLVSPYKAGEQKILCEESRKDKPSPECSRSRLDVNQANDLCKLEGKTEEKNSKKKNDGRKLQNSASIRSKIKPKNINPSSRNVYGRNLKKSPVTLKSCKQTVDSEHGARGVRQSPRRTCKNMPALSATADHYCPNTKDSTRTNVNIGKAKVSQSSPKSRRQVSKYKGARQSPRVLSQKNISSLAHTPAAEDGVKNDEEVAHAEAIIITEPAATYSEKRERTSSLNLPGSKSRAEAKSPKEGRIRPCSVSCKVLDVSSILSNGSTDVCTPITFDPPPETEADMKGVDILDEAECQIVRFAENCAESDKLAVGDVVSMGCDGNLTPESLPKLDVTVGANDANISLESCGAKPLPVAPGTVEHCLDTVELCPVSASNTRKSRLSLNKSRSPSRLSTGTGSTTNDQVQTKAGNTTQSATGTSVSTHGQELTESIDLIIKGDNKVLGEDVAAKFSQSTSTAPEMKRLKKRKPSRGSKRGKKSVVSSKYVRKVKALPIWRRRTFMTVRRFKLPHKWKMLSDRSIDRMFASENDGAEFEGFTEADLSLPLDERSGLSYIEVSEVDLEEKSDIEWEITMKTCDSANGQPLASTLQTLPDFASQEVRAPILNQDHNLGPVIASPLPGDGMAVPAPCHSSTPGGRLTTSAKAENVPPDSNGFNFAFSPPIDRSSLSSVGSPQVQRESGNLETQKKRTVQFSFSSPIDQGNPNQLAASVISRKLPARSVKLPRKSSGDESKASLEACVKNVTNPSGVEQEIEPSAATSKEPTCSRTEFQFTFSDPINQVSSNQIETPTKSGANSLCGVADADEEIQFNFSSPQRLRSVFSPLKSEDNCQPRQSKASGCPKSKTTPRRLDMGDKSEATKENFPLSATSNSTKYVDWKSVTCAVSVQSSSVLRVQPQVDLSSLQEKQKRLVELSREYCPNAVASQFSSPTKCQKVFSAVFARSASPGKSSPKTSKPTHINTLAMCSPSRSAEISAQRLHGVGQSRHRKSDRRLVDPKQPLHQIPEDDQQQRCSPRSNNRTAVEKPSKSLLTPVSKHPEPNRRRSSSKPKPKSQPLDFQDVQHLKRHPVETEGQVQSNQTEGQPRRKLLKTEHDPGDRKSYYRFDYITTAKGKKSSKKVSPSGKSVTSKQREVVHNSDISSKRSASPIFPGTSKTGKKHRADPCERQGTALADL